MTRKEALAALIEKVEAGHQPYSPLQQALRDYDNSPDLARTAIKAATGSLDAALALHEAVLPEWCWSVDRLGQAVVWYPWVEGDALSHDAGGNDGVGDFRLTPARSWLLAILKALHAMEPDT